MTLQRFLRTPKGLLLIALVVLTLVAATSTGFGLVLPGVIASSLTAMVLDAPILKLRRKHWHFPSGALLTGLIIAMVLSPHEPWYIAGVTAAVAIVSKYLVRVRTANVFNPAAFALVATFYVFNTGQSWWGALPELPLPFVALLGAIGLFIVMRTHKLPVALAFLGTWYGLVTVAAFAGNPARVAELYRAPDLHMALYFAFFMASDPPTSPPKARDQVPYGIITGGVAFALFEIVGAAYYLLGALLVANLWEGWRRHAEGVRHARARAAV